MSPARVHVQVRRFAHREEVVVFVEEGHMSRFPESGSCSRLCLGRGKTNNDFLSAAQPQAGFQLRYQSLPRILVRGDLDPRFPDRFLDAISGSPAQAFCEERIETVAVIGRADFEAPLLDGLAHIALSTRSFAGHRGHDYRG